jgi:hypothetical protein
MADSTPMRLDLVEILGAAAGSVVAYLVTTHLPGPVLAIACAVAIALLASASSRLTRPVLWWASVGAIAGSIVGTGSMLAHAVEVEGIGVGVARRYAVMGTLAVAGLLSGIFLGKDIEQASIPRPAELLKRASGLTLVLFAIIVTARFPGEGIEKVRALSSRLSTTVTIVVTTLAVPGWLGFLVGTRMGEWLRARLAQRGLSVEDGFRRHDGAPRQPIQ